MTAPLQYDVPGLARLHFFKPRHRFTVDGKWLPSVSAVGRKFKPPFDADVVAERLAVKRSTTKEAILAEWEAKKQASVALGEELHTAIELYLGISEPATAGAMVAHMAYMSEEAHQRFAVWESRVAPRLTGVAIVNGIRAIELPVWHATLGYAGIADLLAVAEGKLWLFDWKTNGEFREDSPYGDKLLAPFEDLPSCEYTEYSLQATLLRMALASHGVETAGAALVWLGPNGQYRASVALDLSQRLEEVLRTDAGLSPQAQQW